MSRQGSDSDLIIQSDDKKFCFYVAKHLMKFIRSELDSDFFILEHKKELERAKANLFYFKFDEKPVSEFSIMAIDLLSKMDKTKPVFRENAELDYDKIVKRLDKIASEKKEANEDPVDRKTRPVSNKPKLSRFHFPHLLGQPVPPKKGKVTPLSLDDDTLFPSSLPTLPSISKK